MDIFAHGLWTAAASKVINLKLKSKNKKALNVWLATFWGIFPDLFAFTIPFVWLAWGLLTGSLHFSDIPRPETVEPAIRDHFWAFSLASHLYNISHSLIIFSAVFLAVWLIFRRPVWKKGGPPKAGEARPIPWELGGWLLHILIDIPTHSYRFYPTPLFWPVSQWKFLEGFSWGEPWFMALNYSSLLVVWLILWRKNKKSVQKQ